MRYILGVHLDQTEMSGQVLTCLVCIQAPEVSGQYDEENLQK